MTSVTTAINGNISKIATNSAGIQTNLANIALNSGGILTNSGRIVTNKANVTTNSNGVAAQATSLQILQVTILDNVTNIIRQSIAIASLAAAIP